MSIQKKNFSQVDHEVTNEAGFSGGALIVGWKNAIGDMFKMTFATFKTMVLTWITKEQVGLGNVDNTSDLNKPISTATQAALDNILALLSSDEVTLDTLQEIVDFIQVNADDLANLGIANIAGLQSALDAKIAIASIINVLTSTATNQPLSAAQGKVLKDLIDALPAATQTLTNKRITMRYSGTISASTMTPNADTQDMISHTAQAAALTVNNPTGTPTPGQPLEIRIKDNGSSRTLSFGSNFRFFDTQPASTVASKWLYLMCRWNEIDSKWDTFVMKQP